MQISINRFFCKLVERTFDSSACTKIHGSNKQCKYDLVQTIFEFTFMLLGMVYARVLCRVLTGLAH